MNRSSRRGKPSDSDHGSSEESADELTTENRRVVGREPTLTKFSEKDTDIEHFLTGFERVATAYKWPEELWVLKLVPLLTGRALAAYANMDQDAAASYRNVKKAILRRFDINEETYRQRFRSMKKSETQSYMELGVQLKDLFRKWTATAKDNIEELVEILVMEQLLSDMPRELQVWIRQKKPKTVDEAATQADDYVLARQGMKKEEKRCHECREVGHLYRDCPKKEAQKIPEEDHPRKKTDQRKCFKCGGIGHIAVKCPSAKNIGYLLGTPQKRETEGRIPKKLGEFVIWGMIQDTPVEMLVDTGCSQTLVQQRLVPDWCLLEGATVRLQCAHGDIAEYPVAEVDMVIEGERKRVKVGVSDTLPRSVLAGTDVIAEFGRKTVEDCLVMTRSQQRREQSEEDARRKKQEESGAVAKPIQEEVEGETVRLDVLDDDLFGVPGKTRKTRARKRGEKEQWKEKCCVTRRRDLPSGKEQLKKLQVEDPTLEDTRRMVNGDEETKPGVRYEERDGLLYRVVGTVEDRREQLVLPAACRRDVLRLAHTVPMGGHLGQKKTTDRVLKRFYWPGVFQDIKQYCRTCPACQRTAGKRYVPKARLVSLPVVGTPFSRVAMDIVGPLEKSRRGNKYILVVCDYATRYPEAFPLKSIDAETVAEKLVELMSRVGVPDEILTDQGSNFTSQLLAGIYGLLHVKGIKTSPYHPQTDGLVERFNGTLKNMLRRCTSKNPRDWDILLPYLLFSYREVPQESTGFSPFELLFGRAVRGPLDILKESWEGKGDYSEDVITYVIEMRSRLEEMSVLAQENLKKSQVKQKTWYDRRARDRVFKEGDKVLVLLPSSTHKLSAEWQGPYQVVRRMGAVNYEIKVGGPRKKMKIFHVNMLRQWHEAVDTGFLVGCVLTGEEWGEIPEGERVVEQNCELLMGDELSENQRESLVQLVLQYSDVVTSELGRTAVTEHYIHVTTTTPKRQRPYRLPYAKQEEVREELKRMEQMGVIKPSCSEWASPIVLVPKKDGTTRLCVDYRKLNQISRFDAYPVPRIDEMIDKIGKGNYITTLDLNKGYWQIPVGKASQDKTAFITPFGLYEFLMMPFGLQGAPATFQRLMDSVLKGTESFAGAYIDDVAIFSVTWEEHLHHVEYVLEKLRTAGLTANPKKCKFGMSEALYLGYTIGKGQVKPEESKTKAVVNYARPKTKTEVRAFLGLVGYYRKFIHQFSSVVAPLSDLTKKSVKTINWTPDCEQAFQKVKQLLCEAPVLRTPDLSKEMIVQTDASNRGLGGVLSQIGDDGEEHPVVYISRKLLPREERYSIVEKECLAVVWALQTLNIYLYGREFILQTDHQALYWLNRMQTKNARLTRWCLFLQEWRFQIQYRKGTRNGNADALSREPLMEQTSCPLEVEGDVIT